MQFYINLVNKTNIMYNEIRHDPKIVQHNTIITKFTIKFNKRNFFIVLSNVHSERKVKFVSKIKLCSKQI